MKSYQCYAFLCSKNNKAYNDLCVCMGYPRQVGYANGYVAIPHEHPLYGKHYAAPDIYIHGGLTYASSSNELLQLIDSKDLELLDGELSENYWVFGFDTFHAGDNLTTCPREWCVDEVNKLKAILENWK